VSRVGAGLGLVLLLAACDRPPAALTTTDDGRTGRTGVTAERYDRDRAQCRAQVDDETRTRRAIDDSRREVVAGNYDRYGQGGLPRDMANYGEMRNTDRMIANCMEARGWPQQQRSWFPKFGI
jgi:hypothetical protein